MGKKENRRPRDHVPFWRSIQTKYAVIYLLVVATVVVLLNTYPVLMAQDMVFKSKQTTLQSQAAVVASTLAVAETLTPEEVEQSMLLLEDLSATRILVTDSIGMIVYDTSEIEPSVCR